MGVGKYSPTVSFSYRKDQEWFRKNCIDPNSWYDRDGFDSYGYNEQEVDRAGHHENDYLSDGKYCEHSDTVVYDLYEGVSDDWAGKFIPDLPDVERAGVAV